MANYITDLDVSLNDTEEKYLQARGFKKINVNLNEGLEGNHIYLWYKTGQGSAITRLQVTFTNDMADGLNKAGYTMISKDLNTGVVGDFIYLWYFKGSKVYHTPIVEIDVTTNAQDEASKFKDDWERVACDLNRSAGGNKIYIWMKREKQTYICDVDATDSFEKDDDYFQKGYIRVDEDTNRGAGGAKVFIWYRQTTDPKGALSDLKVSIDDQEYKEMKENYELVSVNLNQGTRGNQVYMWYKKQEINPIKGITVIVGKDAVTPYERADVKVIGKNLNEGNPGPIEYLCCHQ